MSVTSTRPRRIAASAAATAMIALAAAGLTAGTASADEAVPPSEPTIVTNCGTWTCSDYVSREGTRQMLDLLNSDQNPADVLSSTACTLGGGKRSPVCKVAKVAIAFGEAMTRRTLEDAVSRNACFKTTYVKHTGAVTWVSTNQGKYCRDR